MKLAGLSVPQTDTISQAHPCRSRKVRINSVQLILLADDRTHFLVAGQPGTFSTVQHESYDQ
jgi:hypothetical protein